MGLDMYLSAERYLWSFTDHDDELGDKIAELFPELDLDKSMYQRVKTVNLQIGYWRKANHIHAWFVDNVQEGKDDCGRYFVSDVKLIELRDLIGSILNSDNQVKAAKELMPCKSGFFFGSTDVDEFYFANMIDTKKMLDKILGNPAMLATWDFYYESSW